MVNYDQISFKSLRRSSRMCEISFFSPDGNMIVSGSYGNTIKLWGKSTGSPFKILKFHNKCSGFFTRLKYDCLRLYDKIIGKSEWISIKNVWRSSIFCEFSGFFDGNKIISVSSDKTIKLWEITTGSLLKTLKCHQDYVNDVVLSPDANMIVSGCSD